MTTTRERPREVLRDRDEFREFLEAHDELDTLAHDVADRLEEPTGPRRGRWMAAAFTLAALLVVAVVAVTVDFGGTDALDRAGETEDQALARLVDEGLVPAQALQPATLWMGHTAAPRPETVETPDQVLARLVRHGYVPAQAMEPATWMGHAAAPRPETVETPDKVLARLVRDGYVPAQALQQAETPDETAATFDLVNRGLVPAATLATVDEAQTTRDLVNRGLVPAGTMPPRDTVVDVNE